MSRFVRPDTTILSISEGDTLVVKTRLNSGEQRDAYARMYRAGLDGSLKVNPFQTGLAMMTAYLVDWSLRDDDGMHVPIKGLSLQELEATLNGLDPDSFAEIRQAIEAHERAQNDQRAEEKKLRAGVNGDGPTLSSPSGVVGALSGSVS